MSGTAALYLAFAALGLKQGDVGLVPSVTFAATANALVYCGAEAYFCDTHPCTVMSGAIHFENAVEELSESGRAAKVYVTVSFSGRVAEMGAIQSLASKTGAYVVEDAAHSLGAVEKGIRSGSCSHSDAAILSFHPVKLVTKAREGAEAFYSGYLSLPLYPNLSADEQSYVIDALGQFCQKLGQPWELVGPW